MSELEKQEISNQNGINSFNNYGYQIDTQNIYSSYHHFRPIIWNNKIKIREQKNNNQDKKNFLISALILVFFLTVFVNYNLDIKKIVDIFSTYYVSFLFFFIAFSILGYLLYLILFVIYVGKKGLLEINDDNVSFTFSETKTTILFKDIRSFSKEKNIIGTSFYIYKEKDLYHTIGFYVELTDVSLAIEELLYCKIYESINNNKNKTKPQTGEIKSMLKHINSFC
ncbi:hypothetical protein N5U22_10660 [Aliarcobacter cryaerophilus]|uniref:hypothetical protein n=1 Tax=Aliarcobacter cryaerophilus TaxID=28198 RepID=UPI0021B68256|nr:hypothetical protein [Aliarcobacter cryaerophilus]MCT7533875.1 hypothetical protein [Aliarcobacter cryaerophilus]